MRGMPFMLANEIFAPPEMLILMAIGLCAGLLGGLLGIGGSVVMIPAMSVIFGPAQHLYQGAAMIVNFFVVIPAVIQHRRAGATRGHRARGSGILICAGGSRRKLPRLVGRAHCIHRV